MIEKNINDCVGCPYDEDCPLKQTECRLKKSVAKKEAKRLARKAMRKERKTK